MEKIKISSTFGMIYSQNVQPDTLSFLKVFFHIKITILVLLQTSQHFEKGDGKLICSR